jgi:hypothetical protein
MEPGPDVIAVRFYFHCGWAVQVDPSFEAEFVEGGETLRMFNGDESREVSLSSLRVMRHDGAPFTADDILAVFPPREFQGLHFEHRSGELAGRALWMFGESDTDPPCWVLMAIMIAAASGKAARCTIVCQDDSDMEWALETWRSIVRSEAPVKTTATLARG